MVSVIVVTVVCAVVFCNDVVVYVVNAIEVEVERVVMGSIVVVIGVKLAVETDKVLVEMRVSVVLEGVIDN